jgi:hypothetical protein
LGFLFSTFRVSRKNKFMLSCVRVQVYFKKNVSLKLKNRIRIFGVFIEKHRVFSKLGKIQKPVSKSIENPILGTVKRLRMHF